MFELHRRYGSREVMELLTEMETVNVDAAGPLSSSRGGPGAIIAAPIRIATSEGGEGVMTILTKTLSATWMSQAKALMAQNLSEISGEARFSASCTKPNT
ncbi:hypothetical protein PIB30_053453 [Stylosanthes scabra]|uniref:Uncharacterized protein n=1 Tax=Stylosanthes scabra TaxID=79078 RepID=A0ABU6TKL4_9FABA|nr:hypothetical protein [Stylosanthes scabra]